MLRLILLGFITSTESASAQQQEDLKGGPRNMSPLYHLHVSLAQSFSNEMVAWNGMIVGKGTLRKIWSGFVLILQISVGEQEPEFKDLLCHNWNP